MRTTAAVVPSRGADFELVEVDLDGPRAGEILVRIEASGLCHTDLSTRDTLPRGDVSPGAGTRGKWRRGGGRGRGSGHLCGRPLVLSFSSCGSCRACSTGHVGYCDRSVSLNYRGVRSDGTTTYSAAGKSLRTRDGSRHSYRSTPACPVEQARHEPHELNKSTTSSARCPEPRPLPPPRRHFHVPAPGETSPQEGCRASTVVWRGPEASIRTGSRGIAGPPRPARSRRPATARPPSLSLFALEPESGEGRRHRRSARACRS